MTAEKPMTIAEAARMLGLSRQVLSKRIATKEAALGKKIVQRTTRGHGAVTVAALRRHFPELFDTADDAELRMQTVLGRFATDIAEIKEAITRQDGNFSALVGAYRKLADRQ